MKSSVLICILLSCNFFIDGFILPQTGTTVILANTGGTLRCHAVATPRCPEQLPAEMEWSPVPSPLQTKSHPTVTSIASTHTNPTPIPAPIRATRVTRATRANTGPWPSLLWLGHLCRHPLPHHQWQSKDSGKFDISILLLLSMLEWQFLGLFSKPNILSWVSPMVTLCSRRGKIFSIFFTLRNFLYCL